jgi:hypothetical protein
MRLALWFAGGNYARNKLYREVTEERNTARRELEDCKLKCVNLQMQILELKRKARKKSTTIKKRKPKNLR